MKVEQNKAFQPITITLETEFEARVLQTLVGNIADTGKFRDTTNEMFRSLGNLGIESFGGNYPSLYSGSIDLES